MEDFLIIKKKKEKHFVKDKSDDASNDILLFVERQSQRVFQIAKIEEDSPEYQMKICQYSPSLLVEWCKPRGHKCNIRVKTTAKFTIKDI